MERISPGRAAFLLALLFMGLVLSSACISRDRVKIRISSTHLSHRILVLDRVETRLKLIVGFTVSGNLPSGPGGTRAYGALSHKGTRFADFTAPRLDHLGGNLVFYLPYKVPAGDYDLRIDLVDRPSGDRIAGTQQRIRSIETIGPRENVDRYNWMQPLSIPREPPPADRLGVSPTEKDRRRGFILWHRHPFRYVYPNSAPQPPDLLTGLSVRLARNDFEPITFSLYGLRNLEKVRVEITRLVSDRGELLPEVKIHVVETVPRIKSMAGDAYEMRPRLLREQSVTSVGDQQSRRYWLTLHAPAATEPAEYHGTVSILSELGRTEVPLTAKVLPLELVERPDKEYGFDMTYVFQEMTAQDLTAEEKQTVYENGVKIYRSFKEHGLTTVIPHSPFVFRRTPDGRPDLSDLRAAAKAFTEIGFTGPFIYYCGHLVQAAKPGWAGSSLGFDPEHHPALMKEIISHARSQIPEMPFMDFYWMPGDEVQDDMGGPSRMEIAGSLLNAIGEMNEKTAISVWTDAPWAADITLGGPRPGKGQHWQYPNQATTLPASVDDAEGLRRAFGLGHVKTDYVGIVPWTFQTSENANGDPYSDIDTSAGRPEVMVAYPGTDGPILTPEYEAVREGIDDGKIAYLLETRIESAGRSEDAALQELGRQAEAAYQGILDRVESAGLEQMDEYRETMVRWILLLRSAEALGGT